MVTRNNIIYSIAANSEILSTSRRALSYYKNGRLSFGFAGKNFCKFVSRAYSKSTSRDNFRKNKLKSSVSY
jgi:hypothetical protein